MPETLPTPQAAPETPLARYLRETRGAGYAFFLTLPFAVFYELGLALFHRAGVRLEVRNGADAILRALFFPHWLEGRGRPAAVLWGGFGLMILFGAILLWHRREKASGWRVRPRPLAAAYGEALGWAVALFAGWLFLLAVGLRELAEPPRQAAGMPPLPPGLKLVLSCGAGVYEELLFRLLLVGVLALFLRGLVGMSRPGAQVVAVAVQAVLFALVHYLGPYEEFGGGAVAYLRFGFRVGAGLFFSGLLWLRGFGMVVAAHAFYDIIVTGIETALAA